LVEPIMRLTAGILIDEVRCFQRKFEEVKAPRSSAAVSIDDRDEWGIPYRRADIPDSDPTGNVHPSTLDKDEWSSTLLAGPDPIRMQDVTDLCSVSNSLIWAHPTTAFWPMRCTRGTSSC
jgi:hypothetical protein